MIFWLKFGIAIWMLTAFVFALGDSWGWAIASAVIASIEFAYLEHVQRQARIDAALAWHEEKLAELDG